MEKKVLVADSDSTVQQVVSYFLKLEGFEVTTAGDGISALEAVDKFYPGVMLLDAGLPGINGMEVGRLVREKPQFRNMPILLLADSKSPLLDEDEYTQSGYGIINKPIDPTKMINTVREYVEKAEVAEKASNESVNIEELLGWKSPEAGVEEEEQMSQEASEDLSDIASGMTVEEGLEDISRQLEDETQETEVSSPELETQPEIQTDMESSSAGMSADIEWPAETPYGTADAPPEAVETEVSEGAEDIKADLMDRVTDDVIKSIVSDIAGNVIERVAWEVIPKIAEEEIKKEIERLKGESE